MCTVWTVNAAFVTIVSLRLFIIPIISCSRSSNMSIVTLSVLKKCSSIDCSNVQPYKSNGTRVVFLNPRPQPKPSKSNSGPSCEICDRILTGPYGRCSIACKVSVVSQKAGGDQNSPSISFPALVISDSSVTENQNPEQNLK
ncbi:hypothetical protein HHK36_024221 [Tetracentron sinense]|uniref:Uncharacterized protein n=1 Tax=Tetracentron sinense TaxID=13715 RepID=A0A835D6H5_TETSI|nr:hypothetical protein HHK36_024221 [Tetracentron sinense]